MNMREGQDGEQIGTPSVISCPGCGGVLREVHDGNLLRFRCRVGHAFSVDSVLAGQNEAVEEALWSALKTLEESAGLSRRLVHDAHQGGKDVLAKRFGERVQEAEKHAAVIRQVLAKSSMDTELTTNAEFVANETQDSPAISQDDPHTEG
jgi:two-component system, chemotaxis family, protein-glutamate methylesterase/glutaminase